MWWWLGAPVRLPSGLGSDGKLYCVSYAPYRDDQDPLVEGTQIHARQIDHDLALIAKYSNCVRTYAVHDGGAAILEAARRYGLKVLFGLWLSGDVEKNRQEIATGVRLANKYRDVITAIVVGNEVLLRGDLSVGNLIATIRSVKAEVTEPVTYADVWEFWLRNPEVANAVDFVTIHVLPYWEDFPIAADRAVAHVASIRARVAAAFPGKDILIGEFGWPSAGRMREGALPSPSNQERAIDETLALAQREHFNVNVIEAFDQPWKRWLEGTVGGQWGIFDRSAGGPKFSLSGDAVSNHPLWRINVLAGVLLAALTFGGALFGARNKAPPSSFWWRIGALAFPPAVLVGWTAEAIPAESFSAGGWLRSISFALVAAAAPIVCAVACAKHRPLPSFSALLGRTGLRLDALDVALGVIFIALFLLSAQTGLGLVFDPRYRDIPFAPICAAVAPFLVLLWSARRPAGSPAIAERVAAALLAAAAIYIVFNESFANWQAVWFCVGLLILAFILASAQDAPS